MDGLVISGEQVRDINLLAGFLAYPQVTNLSTWKEIDAIVICGSEVLLQAEYLFRTLVDNPGLTKVVVLCGGIGHSTGRIYQAVARHPTFSASANYISNLPEARVLEKLFEEYCDASTFTSRGGRLLVEDQSTNCGSNALKSKKVLDEAGFKQIQRLVVIQDPTMARRTVASFEQAYKQVETPPTILSCPVFVPKMQDGNLQPVCPFPGSPDAQFWAPDRFLELLMGEIPRLRDDKHGYGPAGEGFIGHIDIPQDVNQAWARLQTIMNVSR